MKVNVTDKDVILMVKEGFFSAMVMKDILNNTDKTDYIINAS